MARELSADKEKEFLELEAYLDFYVTQVMKISRADPAHPSKALKRMVAVLGRSKSLEGLKQAVNDTIAGQSDLKLSEIKKLDARLRTAGLISYSEVVRRYSVSYSRILKRNKIKSETEYYQIAAMLADGGEQNGKERVQLKTLIADFERGAGMKKSLQGS